jgi:polysaccharide biosynthesis transport protein
MRGTDMALNVPPEVEPGIKSVQVSKYIFLIRRRWFTIVLCVLVCLALAIVDIWRTPVAYRATAQVFVTTTDVKDSSGLFASNEFAQSRVQTYISVVTSPSIVDPVRSALGLSLSARQLTQAIAVDAPLNKTLINIHVRDGSGVRAARIANAITDQFISVIKQIETEKAGTATQSATPVLKLTVIHPATAPASPVAPQKKLLLLLGLFAGLFLGLFFVIIREWLNNRLRSPLDVQAISTLPLLGVIPADRRARSQPNAFQVGTGGPRTEAFRLLRTNLQFVDIDDPPKVMAVTSPLGREGKTTVALNLAASLAEVGFRVGLIEANLREPVLARWLDLDGEIGLTSLLMENVDAGEAAQHVYGGLWVVTSGQLPPNPTELLASKRMRDVISTLAGQFDYLILDGSSLLPVADGAEIVSLAAATVLVVGAEQTTQENFRSAVNAISQVGATIAGVVVNRSSDLERTVRKRGTVPPRGRSRGKGDRTPALGTPVGHAAPVTSQGRDHDDIDVSPTLSTPVGRAAPDISPSPAHRSVDASTANGTPLERAARATAQGATRRRIGQRRPKQPYESTSAQAAVARKEDASVDQRTRDDDDSDSDSGSWLLGH